MGSPVSCSTSCSLSCTKVSFENTQSDSCDGRSHKSAFLTEFPSMSGVAFLWLVERDLFPIQGSLRSVNAVWFSQGTVARRARRKDARRDSFSLRSFDATGRKYKQLKDKSTYALDHQG